MSFTRVVEHGVRLAGEDLDVVPEVGERLRQVTGVNALATDVRLAPIRQVGDAQRRARILGHPGGHDP